MKHTTSCATSASGISSWALEPSWNVAAYDAWQCLVIYTWGLRYGGADWAMKGMPLRGAHFYRGRARQQKQITFSRSSHKSVHTLQTEYSLSLIHRCFTSPPPWIISSDSPHWAGSFSFEHSVSLCGRPNAAGKPREAKPFPEKWRRTSNRLSEKFGFLFLWVLLIRSMNSFLLHKEREIHIKCCGFNFSRQCEKPSVFYTAPAISKHISLQISTDASPWKHRLPCADNHLRAASMWVICSSRPINVLIALFNGSVHPVIEYRSTWEPSRTWYWGKKKKDFLLYLLIHIFQSGKE